MRKAQVTIFVILGIVLLIVASIFMVMRSKLHQQTSPDITHDFSAVKASYEAAAATCIKLEAPAAFQQVFSHGGYADPQAAGLAAFPDVPTAGSAVLLGDDHLVPYWLRQDTGAGCRGGCSYSFHVPALNPGESNGVSVAEQVGDLLESSVKQCLDRWQPSADYDVAMSPDLSITVGIGDGGVSYDLQRDVQLTFVPSGAQTSMREVTASTSDNVKAFYDDAIAVLEQAITSNTSDSLPYAVKTIIEAYGMGSDPQLPPMYGGTRFVFGDGRPDTWMLPDVEEYLRLVLADNLALIHFRNTGGDHLFFDENHYSQAIYNSGPFTPTVFFPDQAEAFNMSFLYQYDPNWPIDLKISPGGYYLKPSGFSTPKVPFLPSIGYYDYSFQYDLVIPILIVAEDKSLFGGQGLTLLYGVETGLSANEPALYGEVPAAEDQSTDFFRSPDYFLDGLISITTKDTLTGAPLADIPLLYACGDNILEVATTNHDGVAKTYLPFCLGGVLYADADGYYSDAVQLSNVDATDQDVTLDLSPVKTFRLKVESYSLFKQFSFDQISDDNGFLSEYQAMADDLQAKGIDPSAGIWNVSTVSSPMLPDESLTVIFTRAVRPGEQEQVEVKYFNSSTAADQTVDLAAGNYTIEAYLTVQLGPDRLIKEIVIPKETLCWGDKFLDFQKKECQDINETRFNDTFYAGGVTFSGDDALVVTVDDYEKSTIVIPYLSLRLADLEKHADLGVLGSMDAYKKVYANGLQPQFE